MTPIFELSSKLFPSSDVRGCENLWNHALRSGPILPFVQEWTEVRAGADGACGRPSSASVSFANEESFKGNERTNEHEGDAFEIVR